MITISWELLAGTAMFVAGVFMFLLATAVKRKIARIRELEAEVERLQKIKEAANLFCDMYETEDCANELVYATDALIESLGRGEVDDAALTAKEEK